MWLLHQQVLNELSAKELGTERGLNKAHRAELLDGSSACLTVLNCISPEPKPALQANLKQKATLVCIAGGDVSIGLYVSSKHVVCFPCNISSGTGQNLILCDSHILQNASFDKCRITSGADVPQWLCFHSSYLY